MESLNPGSECVPGCRFANRQTNLLYENQEAACPQRSAMDLVGGPEIVNDQGEQKKLGQQGSNENLPVTESDGYPGYGGNQQRIRGDVDEAFVSSRIPAVAKRKKQRGPEEQHIG